MRKLRGAFYKDLADLRDAFGDKEYNRDDIVPGVVSLLHKHWPTDPSTMLLRDWANSVLDNAEAVEDKQAQEDFFPHNAQIALGGHGRPRIKRGRINADQAYRRLQLITRNKIAQDRAWANETRWLDETIAALRRYPPDVVREQVLQEDGTPAKKKEPATV